MVQNTTWYLGGTTYKTSNPPYETYPVNELYESEKGIKVYSGHATTSTDYIGLVFPSDYGYASTDASCRQDSNDITCKNNNWLHNGVRYWTISPSSPHANLVFTVHSDGGLDIYDAFCRESVRPSLYLKSDIEIVSGSGTKDDMFKLEI